LRFCADAVVALAAGASIVNAATHTAPPTTHFTIDTSTYPSHCAGGSV
jgi:hypothetical protein